MSNQTKNDKLHYLIDLVFDKANRLFVLSYKIRNDITSFSRYYISTVKIKEYSVLTDGKSFFAVPVRNKKEPYKKIIQIGQENNYATGNLLGYQFFLKALQTDCNKSQQAD